MTAPQDAPEPPSRESATAADRELAHAICREFDLGLSASDCEEKENRALRIIAAHRLAAVARLEKSIAALGVIVAADFDERTVIQGILNRLELGNDLEGSITSVADLAERAVKLDQQLAASVAREKALEALKVECHQLLENVEKYVQRSGNGVPIGVVANTLKVRQLLAP
jgi:hypothetical protein